MPLMHGKSKKAFSKNVEREMHEDKPQKQALAIAYSVKRKASKKAKGGFVDKYAKGGEITVKEEKRPMPEQHYNDSRDVMENDHKRNNGEDGWTDKPTEKQAQMNNGRAVKSIKYPSMKQSPAFKVKLRDEEDHLEEAAKSGPYGKQPEKDHDEEDADSSGHPIRDMEHQHNNGRKPYAKGGMINEEVSFKDAEEDMEEHPAEHLYSDEDAPPKHDYMEEHDAAQYARGGEVDPDEEMAIDHAASIAAAIMAKRRMMARGGEILSEDSIESDDSDQADLRRNAEEDANMEDKASFDALRKENYNESHALEESTHPEDSNTHSPEHDEEDVNDRSIVSAIRRKMKSKSPITR